MRPVPVIVCGGRKYDNRATVFDVLGRMLLLNVCIVHGNATGADTLARQWAQFYQKATWPFPAEWDLYGKSAGVIRNVAMLETSDASSLVAFPGGVGTAHMTNIAIGKAPRVMVHVVDEKGAVSHEPCI